MLTSIYKLPFRIGEHYENWEFDLLVEELCNTYEMYRYAKGDIEIYAGFKVTDIFLYFSFDILFQVELFMEQKETLYQEFHKIQDGLSIRARLIDKPNLIEFTYNKHNIWRDLM